MAYQWHDMEHRWGERVRVNIPVQVSARLLDDIDGCIKNLSLSGALMKTAVDLPLHALIEVTIKLPAPAPHTEAILAHVSRKLKNDVGVEWCEFAPSVVKELLRSPSVRLP